MSILLIGVGVFAVGFLAGVFTVCCVVIAKAEDKSIEKMRKEHEEV